MVGLWNWIISASAPRVAAKQSSYREIESLEETVLAESLERILRTCRGEAAAGRGQRGYAPLVEEDQKHERGYCDLLDDFGELGHGRLFSAVYCSENLCDLCADDA